MDDKLIVIIAVSIITLFAMWAFKVEAMELTQMAISGLLGLATGKLLK